MDKKHLLTIGSVSQQTGVHVKSLRYYDRIGILTPAYIDSETGYRYYDFSQIPIVQAIQLCVELDIPLSRFEEFMTDDKKSVRFGKLITCGTLLADEKIKAINDRLDMLDKMRKSIRHAESYGSRNGPVELEIPEKYYWTVPYDGESEYRTKFTRIMEDITRSGLKIEYDGGFLMFYRGGEVQRFFYMEVGMETDGTALPDEILYLPSASYRCMKTDVFDIEQAERFFPDLFAQEYDKIVMETELFQNNYDVFHPQYEVRCSLPKKEW